MRMISWFLGFAWLASVAAPARADTIAPATIEHDTVWAAADAPVLVSEDVTVAAGVRLRVEAGVDVVFSEGRVLTVHGEILARGTAEEPVRFVGQEIDGEMARWGSVVLSAEAVDASLDPWGVYESGSIFEGCVFEGATRALVLDDASPLIRGCTFRRNLCATQGDIDVEGGAAIQANLGSGPRIDGCLFEHNRCEGSANGGAIYAEEGAPVIQGNDFRDNYSFYGGAVAVWSVYSPIAENRFEGNEAFWEGGAVSLLSSSGALLANHVEGNHARADGGGVHICVTCYPHANPHVADNVIIGNTNQLEGGAGFGAAFLRAFRDNTLHDNVKGTEPSDFAWNNDFLDKYPEWVTRPDISGNWWGTTDLEAVAATVHDGADEERLGRVTVAPVLAAPPASASPRALLGTRKISYGIEGEPMPLYLTLYNPGVAREVEILIMLQYEGEAPVPWRGELPWADATWRGGRFALTLPAGGLSFGHLLEVSYPTMGSLFGAWRALMWDAETGELLGAPCELRFELGREVGHE